jgi:hypothetical protein
MRKKNERNAGMPNAKERKEREELSKNIRLLIKANCSTNLMIQYILQNRKTWSYQQAQRLVLKTKKEL